MKTENLHEQLKSLLPEYARPQMALTEFLKIIKDTKNTIEPEDVTALSKMCEVKAEDVLKIMDRYQRFSDAEESAIHVCTGLPCYLNGAQNLLDEIVSEQKKLNGSARPVKEAHCLGYCHEAPVVQLGDGIKYSGRTM